VPQDVLCALFGKAQNLRRHNRSGDGATRAFSSEVDRTAARVKKMRENKNIEPVPMQSERIRL
jgi:hypothetical protein